MSVATTRPSSPDADSKVFDVYAHYYDLLYRDKNYAAEAGYVANSISNAAPAAKCVLDLGCGTGTHAVHFAHLGYAVHGIDRSAEMLAEAERRKTTFSVDVAARLSFSRGDLVSLRLGKTFDAVVSLFHVASYQTKDSDVASFFETAAVHLSSGGLLLFDFWFGPAVERERPEIRVKRLEDDRTRVTRIAEPDMRSDSHRVDVHYEVFVEDRAAKSITRIREIHSMRYFFLPELRDFYSRNFEEVSTTEWMSTSAPTAATWSAFQVLRRR